MWFLAIALATAAVLWLGIFVYNTERGRSDPESVRRRRRAVMIIAQAGVMLLVLFVAWLRGTIP